MLLAINGLKKIINIKINLDSTDTEYYENIFQ
jgi:hypothetical protein